MPKKHATPTCYCPLCGTRLQGAENLTSRRKPVAGDFVVCCNCGTILRFGSDMRCRQMADVDRSALAMNAKLDDYLKRVSMDVARKLTKR